MSTGKHVIFLGAGASHGSGYPLANELRLLISSRKHWEKKLRDYAEQHNRFPGTFVDMGLPFWDKHIQALTLFRNGGFATLDEFCLLAGGKFQKEINGLRRLVRAALGLFNPEEHFEDSEYYGFVQALFKEDLKSLREDITVLTYNYDPYLEFLLHRALDHRWRITQGREEMFLNGERDGLFKALPNVLSAATSGFDDPENLSWLEGDKTKPSFCVLKLHGSICCRVDTVGGYETLFSGDPLKRAPNLFQGHADSNTPPILFPWEIITNQEFVSDNSVLFQHLGHLYPSLYPLLHGIWERAKREVQAAKKISFVGLSMHPLLSDGLKYLFEGKTGEVEICIVNPDNPVFILGKPETHWGNQPSSPAYVLNKILGKVAPHISRYGIITGGAKSGGDMTPVNDFRTFIKTQMKPL